MAAARIPAAMSSGDGDADRSGLCGDG
jgi:hypothetical protein